MLVSLLLQLFTFGSLAFAADQKNSGTTPTYMVTGDAKLYTHFIERGLSMSNNNPALNAEFLFNFGSQFKVGFWGSNISNVSQSDDNFWLKYLAEIRVDFSTKSNLRFYIHDNHYYKSDVRNGQEMGVNVDHNNYLFQLAWMNNFEGTHTSAQYLNLGKLFTYRKSMKYGGLAGYTLQTADGYANYFDFKALGIYEINANAIGEIGITMLSNSQFGSRGDPAYYLAFAFNF